ncbi:MAG: hypothetical protein ABIL25_03680 [candidate division WOR-3 bacterium]
MIHRCRRRINWLKSGNHLNNNVLYAEVSLGIPAGELLPRSLGNQLERLLYQKHWLPVGTMVSHPVFPEQSSLNSPSLSLELQLLLFSELPFEPVRMLRDIL